MPPRRRPPSGYHGVGARPSGRVDAEIRSGEERIRLGTFDTAHEAARAYDAVAWRLGRSRRAMNFHDVFTRERALRVEWARRFPEDVAATAAFYAEKDKKEEEKAAEKAKKKASREKRRAESAARKAARINAIKYTGVSATHRRHSPGVAAEKPKPTAQEPFSGESTPSWSTT
nr:ethylene-responsive transcription factor ERF084-like [Lolium perenne]